jgi:hypothetical protein
VFVEREQVIGVCDVGIEFGKAEIGQVVGVALDF